MTRRIRLAAATLAGFALFGCGGRAQDQARAVTASNVSQSRPAPAPTNVAQSTMVDFDPRIFDVAIAGTEQRFRLPVSPTRSLTVDVDSVTRRGGTDVALKGHVLLPNAVVYLDRVAGVVSGLVEAPGQGRIVLVQQPDGRLEVTQFEANLTLQCAYEGQADLIGTTCPNRGLSEIRVLILYDDEVAEGRGEQTLLAALPVIVDRSNDVLSQSLVDVKLSVVQTKQFTIVEQNTLQQDLDMLKMPSGVHAAAILAEKRAANADVVMFMVKNATGADGIANLLTAPFDQFGIHALGVITYGAFLSKYVFVHEIGHTMGAGHQGGPGAFTTSRGMVWPATALGTAMATAVGVLPYFSNPKVSVSGIAMGDPSHDNAGTLNATRGCVENFRTQ